MAGILETFRVTVLGAGGSGKSTLSLRLAQGRFVDEYDPTIEDMMKCVVEMGGEQVALEIFDTCFLEFDGWAYRKRYMIATHGFIILFSVTSTSSFEEISEYRNQIERVFPFHSIPVILVGTKKKKDLESERSVSLDQAHQLAQNWGVQYFDISSKTKVNVMPAIQTLVHQMKTSPELRSRPPIHSKRRTGCHIM